jgi:chromosome segregation ATPase
MENLRSDSMRASKNQAVAGAENHESVRNELAAIKEELVRAQEMLEREKEQHKLDLQALSYTRKQVVSQERAQAETKIKIGALENELAQIKNEMESAQNVAAVIKGEDSQLVQQLRQHNEILLDQLQRGGGGGQSELHQVIKCLRREKDMAQSKSDVFETKAANLELQLRTLETKCSELEELCDRRSAAEASQTLVTIPQSKFDELLQQAETLNALTDSSIVQRETNVALSAELNELRPKLKSVLEELESLKSRNNLFQEKIVSEEENVAELNNKIRELTGKITLAEERVVELEEQLNSSQSQLSNNTETLRTKLNVQNQELLKKNFEVRKLSSEKENLLKQSTTDKESLAKVSVELTKEKAAVVEANAQLVQLKSSLAEAQKEAAKVAELNENLQQAKDAVTKKDAEMAVITAREIKVRYFHAA